MMGMKMITSTSMLVEKKFSPRSSEEKNNLQPSLSVLWPTHSYNQSAWIEFRKTLEWGSLAYSKRTDDKNEIHLAKTKQRAISSTKNGMVWSY